MGIKNNLTFVIVTYESDKVINDCLSSIPSNYPIIIIENSGKKNFQEKKISLGPSDFFQL